MHTPSITRLHYRKFALSAAIPLSLVTLALPARAYNYETSSSGNNLHWVDQNPATPNTIDIYYTFGTDPTYPNQLTATEKSLFVQALSDWSAVTGGKLVFTQSASASHVLDLRACDLALLGGNSGQMTLGLTSNDYRLDGVINKSLVCLDYLQNWDFNIANGNPPFHGSLIPDFYDVAIHEIGHALGLDHCDYSDGDFYGNIMTSILYGEKLGPARDDINAICNLYGVDPTPYYNVISRSESSFIVGSPFNTSDNKQYNFFENSSGHSIFSYYIDSGTTTIIGTTGIQDNASFHQSGGIWNTAALSVGLPGTDNSSTGLFELAGGMFTTASATVNMGSTFQQSDGVFTASSVAINDGGALQLSGGTLNTQSLSRTGSGTFDWSGGTLSLSGAASISGISTLTIPYGGALKTTAPLALSSITNYGTLRLNPTAAITFPTPISGTGDLVHEGPGTTTLTGPYTATGALTISSGKLQFAITNGPRQSPAVLLNLMSLSIASGGVLDITNHDLMIGNSALSIVETAILAGWGLGTPGSPALTSSTARAAGNMFLVPFAATGSTFDGVSVTQPNTILVKYTYIGDLNLDGKVDAADFTIASANAGASTPGRADFSAAWQMGDVTLDGIVNALDFATMAANFGAGVGGSYAQLQAPTPFPDNTPIPEPATLSVLSLATTLLLRRRRSPQRHA